ncbi:MAG: hypothetical protein RIB98_11770 [Acidimicrobiales bacterium]
MPPVLVAGPTDDARRLAEAIDADTIWLPDSAATTDWAQAGGLEEWRETHGDGPRHHAVVVMAESADIEPLAAVELDGDAWIRRTEMPLARWAVALAVATRRVADGGSIVVVVDQAASLDVTGWAPETAVADAVEALVRSLAKSEGARGVRVNLVTSPRRLVSAPVSPPPPLSTFPGTLDDVISAVAAILAGDVAIVTGAVVHVDAGRAYR